MLARYVHILLNFNINSFAKSRIIQIIIDALDEQLSSDDLIGNQNINLKKYFISQIAKNISAPVFIAHEMIDSYFYEESDVEPITKCF